MMLCSMYVYIYMYIYTYVYTHLRILIYAYMHIDIYIYICVSKEDIGIISGKTIVGYTAGFVVVSMSAALAPGCDFCS